MAPIPPAPIPPEDPGRRIVLKAGLAALPMLAAGCGGGAGDAATPGTASRAVPMRAQEAVAAGYPIRVQPTVGTLGATSILGPAEATSAWWLVINAGTDTQALSVLSGLSTAAPRVVLPALALQSSRLALQADLSIRSIHVARAGQAGYTMTTASALSGALVARWNFDSGDQIRCVELMAHPAVVAGDLPELTCSGWAA